MTYDLKIKASFVAFSVLATCFLQIVAVSTLFQEEETFHDFSSFTHGISNKLRQLKQCRRIKCQGNRVCEQSGCGHCSYFGKCTTKDFHPPPPTKKTCSSRQCNNNEQCWNNGCGSCDLKQGQRRCKDCVDDGDCSPSQYCEENMCRDEKRIGERCNSNQMCRSGCCDYDHDLFGEHCAREDKCYSRSNTCSTSCKEITTTNQISAEGHGSMFNVVARNDISVLGFDIRTRHDGLLSAEVYTKPGKYYRYEEKENSWTLVMGGKAVMAKNGEAILGTLDLPVSIPKGCEQSFYVTLRESAMGYEYGYDEGNEFTRNADIIFNEGIVVDYKFKSSSVVTPCIWSGKIRYQRILIQTKSACS